MTRQLIDLVRYPLGTFAQILQDMVPWLGETISIGTKLQIVLGHTFSARQVRIFKKQFGYQGSFAIPLARIEGLAMTQPFWPAGNLEVSFVGDNDLPARVWFRSAPFAANQPSRRNWVVGRQESVRDWAQEWIDRIRLIALGEGRLIEDGAARLPDWLVWQSRPVNVWNRGDHGPLSNSAVAKIQARAPWAIATMIGLMFAIWSAPVIVFILLVQSGNDPVDWLGTWGPAFLLVGIAAWIAFFFVAMKLAATITFRFFPRIEPRDHFEFWHQGPMSVLNDPEGTLRRLAEAPKGLEVVIDRTESKYRTPPAHTRLAIGEMIMRALEAPEPSIRQLARQVIASMPPDGSSHAFPADPLTKTNIYLAENMRLIECDGLVSGAGIILIGLDEVYLVAGGDSGSLLEFDDFDDLTANTIERLTGLLSGAAGTALPLRALRDVRATAQEFDEAKKPNEVPMLVRFEFDGDDGNRRICCFETATHKTAFQLMGIVWCAATLVGNILVWSETELRLLRDTDPNLSAG